MEIANAGGNEVTVSVPGVACRLKIGLSGRELLKQVAARAELGSQEEHPSPRIPGRIPGGASFTAGGLRPSTPSPSSNFSWGAPATHRH